jgi:nitrate reductase gamma subunit
MEWVINNKEWLFSGLGVSILAGIGAFLYKRFFSKEKSTISQTQDP